MGIFSAIKDAIFGHHASATASPSPTSQTQRNSPTIGPNVAPSARPATAPSGIPASPANAKWDRPVDVEQVMTDLASKSNQKLNWQTSIVDLMKLLGLDSSLANRKELARELGYTGDTNDSAAMNVWLHKRVMQELEKNGGKVPASLVA
jgi:hypothetical protein